MSSHRADSLAGSEEARTERPAARRARFERLALPHLDALYGMALRLTRDGRDAEDLVQDTLLLAYQGFASFAGQDRCKPWLFKILTNTFVNKYRRRVLERDVADAMEHEDRPRLLSDAAVRLSRDPEASLHASLLSEDVRKALATLPDEFRMAVLLCDIQEFSYREIADIMECPVGTVMSRLYRGRRLLQEVLRGRAQEEGLLRDSGAKGAAVIPIRSRGGAEEG